MKLQKSAFLAQVKDDLQKLVEILTEDFEFVSILATDVYGQHLTYSTSSMDINSSPDEERGFVCRVQTSEGFSEYSFNKLDSLEEIVAAVKACYAQDRKLFLEHSQPLSYPEIMEEKALQVEYCDEVSQDPQSLDAQEILKLLAAVHDEVKTEHEKLVQIYLSYQWTQVNKLYVSSKRDLEQSYLYSEFVSMAIAREGEKVRDEFLSSSSTDLAVDYEQWLALTREAAQRAEELLHADELKAGEYDVIFDPDFSGLIAHEAFGHGTEMDMFVKERAKGKEYLGKFVAAPQVRMHDGAKAYKENSSYFFDDEGNLGQDTLIIDDGVFKNGMCDQLSAMQLGRNASGNGKRESYAKKAYTRMTNTLFEAGEDSLEDMIASIDYGFLIEGAGGGMEDPKNWGIQCEASKGREIKNGKLTGRIVSPVYVTGYVPDLLQSMSMFSPEIKMSGIGYCGKGWKEWVKVSSGGPYIKAKAKLS